MSPSGKQEHTGFSAGKALAAVLAIVFVAEFLIMAVMARLGLVRPHIAVYIINAAVLAAATGPAILILVLLPMRRIMARAGATAASRAAAETEGDTKTEAGQAPLSYDQPESRFDTFTQVLNRQSITGDLVEAMAQSERYGNALSVAMIDIDHLKQINEEQGRGAGDEVLVGTAGLLTEILRMPDRVGRYLGEEFLVVLPQTSASDASIIANRIRESVGQTDQNGDKGTFRATVSIGITEYQHGDDMGGILMRAESAVREAKAQGGNRVVTQ